MGPTVVVGNPWIVTISEVWIELSELVMQRAMGPFVDTKHKMKQNVMYTERYIKQPYYFIILSAKKYKRAYSSNPIPSDFLFPVWQF